MTSLSTQLDINALVEMGFTKDRVELAVKSVKNPDIQSVVEWLFNHPVQDNNSGHRLGDTASDAQQTEATESNGTNKTDFVARSGEILKDDVDEVVTPNEGDATAMEGATSETPAALSLVCEDCGKQIRSEMDAQTHAARTGHQHFAESSEEVTALTTEEKEAHKIRLQQKLEDRRKERETAEKEQDKLREKTRRKTGQELRQARDEQAYKEMKRLADERRQEKRDEQRLKQKLKEDIARDRAEFKKQHTSAPVAMPSMAETMHSQPIIAKKEYDTCRIQFRLVDGSTQNSSFKADDSLQVIYNHLSEQVMNNMPFDLSMTFPRKVFSEEDKCKTLKELGLVPSAVLVLRKCM